MEFLSDYPPIWETAVWLACVIPATAILLAVVAIATVLLWHAILYVYENFDELNKV